MNHIKKLENNLDTYARAIKDMEQEIIGLKQYLNSPKFYYDTTVQAKDVLNRLENIEIAYKDRLFNLE